MAHPRPDGRPGQAPLQDRIPLHPRRRALKPNSISARPALPSVLIPNVVDMILCDPASTAVVRALPIPQSLSYQCLRTSQNSDSSPVTLKWYSKVSTNGYHVIKSVNYRSKPEGAHR